MQLSGGQLTVQAGTTIRVEGPVTWQIPSGAAVVNDGAIDLGAEAGLDEAAGAPITGNGTETAIRDLATPFAAVDPGGLGLVLSHPEGIGTATITRGHAPIATVAGESIARWYTLEATAPGNVPLGMVVRYDATELNGLDAGSLLLHKHMVAEDHWQAIEGTANAMEHTVSGTSGAPWALISAFHEDLVLATDAAMDPAAAHRVWPTLTTGLVHMQAAQGEMIRTAELFGMTGQRHVIPLTGTPEAATFDIGHLSSGAYILRLNGTSTHRLIKQ